MAEVEVIGAVRGFVSPGAIVPPKQGIYESSDVARTRLGTRLQVGPRIFYYAKYAADVAVGELVGVDTSVGDVVDTDDVIVCDGNYTAPIGATKIEILLSGRTKDAHAGGFFHITGNTGVGYTYGIKGNSATGEKINSTDLALDAATSFILELYDPLVLALANDTTDFAITGSPFNHLRECPSSAAVDDCPTGVCPIPFDISIAPYGWVQTWGPANVLQDGAAATTKGQPAAVSDGDAGAVQLANAYTEHIVGYGMEDGDTSGHAPVFLQLIP
ncbi:hypothetical protein LCGC14_0407210 [marine sediment metagenome]|uniref:Uncharacterized protein n=1 Tax=marine sediment metagenome TaxID=412755 RepID=A0A0F9VH89_9ZZZZ